MVQVKVEKRSPPTGGGAESVGDGDGGQAETGGGVHGGAKETRETGRRHGAEQSGAGGVTEDARAPDCGSRLGERGQDRTQTEVGLVHMEKTNSSLFHVEKEENERRERGGMLKCTHTCII